MKRKTQFLYIILGSVLISCNGNGNEFDASGTFETDEVVVSSTANGQLLFFNLDEGSVLAKDSLIALVDPTGLNLQKEEVDATIQALNQQTLNVSPQVQLLNDQMKVQQSQMNNLLHEKKRIENLLKQDAATGKQLDDINAQIDVVNKQIAVTQQQINVQRNTIGTQNRSILSQKKPLEKKAAQVEDMLNKTKILNPVQGTVITKYALAGEITSVGKPLYKVADLSYMNLRAYVTGNQLPNIKLGQSVRVFIDQGTEKFKEYEGTIIWISDEAEFTPKTIQTKEERANLVYAVKVKVKNDGYLKIGMYGEMKL
jgi:HlyD family secretion protein